MDEMTTLGFNVEAGLGQNGCFYNTLIHKTLIKIEFNLSETINVRVYPYIYIDIKLYHICISVFIPQKALISVVFNRAKTIQRNASSTNS